QHGESEKKQADDVPSSFSQGVRPAFPSGGYNLMPDEESSARKEDNGEQLGDTVGKEPRPPLPRQATGVEGVSVNAKEGTIHQQNNNGRQTREESGEKRRDGDGGVVPPKDRGKQGLFLRFHGVAPS